MADEFERLLAEAVEAAVSYALALQRYVEASHEFGRANDRVCTTRTLAFAASGMSDDEFRTVFAEARAAQENDDAG